jgi:hypothetical protein
MNINIEGSSIYLELRIGDREGSLQLDGGQWYLLTGHGYRAHKWIAQGRVALPTVIARALTELMPQEEG